MADRAIEAPEVSGFSAIGASVLHRRALNEAIVIIAVAVTVIGCLEC